MSINSFAVPAIRVLVEQFTYAGTLSRLRGLGVNPVGIPLDESGMRADLLAAKLAELKAQGIRPKFIYVIPTIQNPDGSIMPEGRRAELLQVSAEYGVPIFEDECYADLLWTGERPPAIAAMDEGRQVIHCGSFSKTIAPALRVGYIVAEPGLVAQIAACKEDGGTGALEQMMLSEYCWSHFVRPCRQGHPAAQGKARRNDRGAGRALRNDGRIHGATWRNLPVGLLPGRRGRHEAGICRRSQGSGDQPRPDWSADAAPARSRIRLCFGNPTHQAIRDGVKVLAEVCHEEFGVPVRSGNIERNSQSN